MGEHKTEKLNPNNAAGQVLIAGGSGYLGQFLIDYFSSKEYDVAYTYCSNPLTGLASTSVKAFKVDYATGAGLDACLGALLGVDLVVNCVAMSSPAHCEADPDTARAVNVPQHLVQGLTHHYERRKLGPPLLIHLSTDQVYRGDRPMWRETDPPDPVNHYGRTKLAAERHLAAAYPRSIALRSSIIYGPPAPYGCPRELFVQFVDRRVTRQVDTTFYADEYRCPVLVHDLCRVVHRLSDMREGLPQVFNAGGPDRLSRVDMARVVAGLRGVGTGCIQEGSAADRAIPSPLDISMTGDKLQQQTGLQLTGFMDGAKQALLQQQPPAKS